MFLEPLFLKRMRERVENFQNLNIGDFKHSYSYVLICIPLLLLSITMILNICNGTYTMLPLFAVVTAIILAAGIILYFKNNTLVYVQCVVLFLLCILGIALLLHQGTYDVTVSLIWFVIFPSMMMFTMGLYYGTLTFFTYFTLLALLLFLPYDMGVNESISTGIRVRLLLAMLGSFLYSWGAEYIRHNTQRTLEKLLEDAEKIANTDTLTGLRNRRDFQNILANIISVSESTRKPFAVIMMDIDFFKKVNDTYGHDTGDLVLKHFANTLTLQKRSGDFLFRWGGEEFVLIIPGIDSAEVLAVANRIRKYTAQQSFETEKVKISYTVSMGIYNGNGLEGRNNIIEIADANMYKAKRAGRNCVIM